MARGRQQQQAQGEVTEGLPEGLRLYTPFPFGGGVEAKGSVAAIDDDKFAWLENVMWHGRGQLVLLYGQGASFYTAPVGKTIISHYYYYINPTQYAVVFLSDGSAVQVNVGSGAQIAIAAANTFKVDDPNRPPVATGWQGKWLIIATYNAYYVWDGTLLFRPGSLGPEVTITNGGSGLSSAPTVTISGGSGTGASAVATIVNGTVTKVTMTAPGSGFVFDDLARINFVFTGGGITNKVALGHATIGAAGVIGITVLDGGTGYTNEPSVTLSGGGATTQATAVASGTAQSITNITVVTPGAGYTGTPTVTIGAPSGGGNTATAVAQIGYRGITSITVDDIGQGYTSTPTVQITDPTGSGSGAVAVAVMGADTVASVTIINPGHNYQDAVVRFVGGNPTVAAATGSVMPQGGQNPVSGAAVEIFQNRVWMVNGTFRYTSAAASVTLFSASSGGVIVPNTDSFLQFALLGLRQANGFLYEFGDSSINSISPPTTTTSGNVVSTQYTVTNIDPQIGCDWPETIQIFGQALLFTRIDGVYAIYGSRLEKISTVLDDLFVSVPNQAVRPSAAVAVINGIKCYIVTLVLVDPIQNSTRRLMVCWDGFRWFFATQGATVTLRTFSDINGNFYQAPLSAWGTDASSLYQCFTTPSTSLTKKIISKFYGLEAAQQYKQALRFYFSAEQQITYDIVLHNEVVDLDLGSTSYPDSAGPTGPNAYGGFLTVMGRDTQFNGHLLGWTWSTTAASGNVDYMALAYRYYAPYY